MSDESKMVDLIRDRVAQGVEKSAWRVFEDEEATKELKILRLKQDLVLEGSKRLVSAVKQFGGPGFEAQWESFQQQVRDLDVAERDAYLSQENQEELDERRRRAYQPVPESIATALRDSSPMKDLRSTLLDERAEEINRITRTLESVRVAGESLEQTLTRLIRNATEDH